jgi:two-component system, LuxR family, response regulator FixJ
MMQLPEIVHVIDDDEGVRNGLCALLEAKKYAASPHVSCEDFLKSYLVETSLCVVADLCMPGMGGLELQEQLLKDNVALPFIVITGHGDVSSAVRALKAGAVDFIEKPIDGKAFIDAVNKAATSRRDVYHRAAEITSAIERISALTPREHEVLRHLIEGNPNKIIAHQLNISARTVENHRARLMVKMQADSVAELVRLALAAGINTNAGSSSPVK